MSSESKGLKKTITLSKGFSLTVGSIVGSGLLALPGIAYVEFGSSSLIAWLTTALLVLPFVFIFSSLASRYPSAGGIYEFSKRAFGDKVSQIIAFIIAGTWPIGIPILAIIGSNYLTRVFFMPESLVPVIAFLMLSVATILNYFGAEISGRVQTIVVTLTILLLSSVVFIGAPISAVKLDFNFKDVWMAMSLIFWAYLGLENVTFLSEEFRDSGDIIKSMLIGLLFVVFLYFGLSYVVVGLLPKTHATEMTPIIEVIDIVGGKYAGIVAGIVSVLIVFLNINAWVWGASRSIYSASRDKALPEFLSRVNRYGAPYVALITLLVVWVVTLSLYAFLKLNLATMFRFANQNFVIMYLASVMAYLKLKGNRLFGFVTLAVIAIFMFSYSYALIYPVILTIVALMYDIIKR